MPELPPLFRWRHSATSSKLVIGFCDRVTPTGLPVQCTPSAVQVQVSGSQLTLTKSSAAQLPPARPGAVDRGLGECRRLRPIQAKTRESRATKGEQPDQRQG